MQLKLALLALHLLGAIFWVGGIAALAMLVLSAQKTGGKTVSGSSVDQAGAARLARFVARRVVTPAMLIAFVGGLAMFAMGIDGYLKMGWLHGKITLAVVAAGLSGVLTAKLKRVADGEPPRAIAGLTIGVVLVAVLILILGIFGNVWMPARG